jgi:hypothetical protein
VSGTKFEVATRYRIIKPVGHGAYGVVVYVPPPPDTPPAATQALRLSPMCDR